MSCAADPLLEFIYPIRDRRVAQRPTGPVCLSASVDMGRIRFSFSLDDAGWTEIPAAIDAGGLCDEAGKGDGANFTGTFVGICCDSLIGLRRHADFDYLRYEPRGSRRLGAT